MADSAFRINRGITLNPQGSAPSNPTNGDIYFDSTTNTYSLYQNNNWINLASKIDVASAASLTSADFTSSTIKHSLVRVTGSTASALHGMTASGDAKQTTIYNASTQPLIIRNESTTEISVINRILTVNGADITLNAGQCMTFIYDSTQSRWIAASSVGLGDDGSGLGDDLASVLFRASFTDALKEVPSNVNNAVNHSAAYTNATFNTAKELYEISYDASKTVTGTGTSMTMSSGPAFTVQNGDILIVGLEARKITNVISQTSYTIESAFTSNPSSAACCVSQVVHTKDIYGTAFDGNSIASAFGAETFSEILVKYEDTSTINDNIFDLNTAPVVAFCASHNGTSWTTVKTRPTLETEVINSINLNSAGTALYLRFFANKTSSSGTVNILSYKAFMQKFSTSEVDTENYVSVITVTNDKILTNLNSVVLANASSVGSTLTVTLPNPISGKIFNIKKIDSSVKTVTVATLSGTIDGSSTKIIAFQYDSLSIVSDGSNYHLI